MTGGSQGRYWGNQGDREDVSGGCVQTGLGDSCSGACLSLRDDEAEGEVGNCCLVFSLLFPSCGTSGGRVWMHKLIFGPTGNGP